MNEQTEHEDINDPPGQPASSPEHEPEVNPDDPDIEGLPGEQQQPA